MPELDATLSGYVAGDPLEVRRTVTTPTAAIAAAWLTLKTHAGQSDADAALQKEITTDEQAGVGWIATAGGPSEDALLRFYLTAEETRALGTKSYLFDVQVLLDGGLGPYTLEIGTFQLTGDVTKASEAS